MLTVVQVHRVTVGKTLTVTSRHNRLSFVVRTIRYDAEASMFILTNGRRLDDERCKLQYFTEDTLLDLMANGSAIETDGQSCFKMTLK